MIFEKLHTPFHFKVCKSSPFGGFQMHLPGQFFFFWMVYIWDGRHWCYHVAWPDSMLLLLFSHVQLFVTPRIVAHQLFCLPLSLGVCSNSYPLSQWHYLSHPLPPPFSFCLQSFLVSIRVFSNESSLCIRWPKYWHFSFNSKPFSIQLAKLIIICRLFFL